eukprot:TRINITY_DN261_c0_g1_i4.p2 TRINITY_DN261_c0_g1~~TRINITY_DN261_c0_g1_i4.p2  ORF type:complete len:253 (+),score=111.70 TRINITY_DN261_c0_g1_i4:37-759(+)
MASRVAVVTGGTRGIGFEITKGLAKLDAFKVLFTARSAEAGEATVQKLGESGVDVSKVSFFVVDVTEDGGAQRAADHVREKFGAAHVLVNNAGVFLDREHKAADVPIDLVRQTFEINTLGPLRFIQAFLPFFKEGNYGRIVNVSSTFGSIELMNCEYPGYKVSKAALNAVTRIVSDEVKDLNILVNSMCPGYCKTDMTSKMPGEPPKTAEQGADKAIFLATLPDDGIRGQFVGDNETIPW